MAFLIFAARIHELCKQRSDVQYKLNKLSRKLMQLHEYAAAIGSNNISIGDILKCSGAMMGRAIGYLSYANAYGMQYMNQNAPMMTMMYQQQYGAFMQNNPQQYAMMQNYIMNSLFQQGREIARQQEEKNLKVEEGKIAAEKDTLQVQLQQITEELKSAVEARNQGIKDLAPKYTGVA